MTFRDASKEFELDCKVRHLSPKTIGNYTKQLRYLENYLSSEFSVLNIEDVKPAHIKSFMAKMDDAGRKPQSPWFYIDLPFAKPCNNIAMRLPLQGRTNSGKSNSSD